MRGTKFPNIALFAGINGCRVCLLQLSASGFHATRVRIQPDSVVIEITAPLRGVDPVTERGDYAYVRYFDCNVIWRKATQGGELGEEA